jgi:hypothetical protein
MEEKVEIADSIATEIVPESSAAETS